ncbi:MAG TPA: tRNA (adenosine(37)-N6)-threonylcarbamoyltransferase complex dimerization subunit type 1 TsaB [Solirubrobacteraceae bacterium]|jgi:tRNA threonylcarbamoyladenosine biosynthesis protein TsaB|nr:tRNA (adenosine(37)-N6)-threonylcarbamoyltransferase complex dimerization subunit type 1 TsaB [Solirubrobacteraceae bacterium]
MIVLGFDTATSSTAVALRRADGGVTQARDDPPAGARPGHATRLLDLARGLLEHAGVAWSEVDRVAVGVGPGTFTGLRVGVATARGLAQSLSAELVGVSSARALALPALAGEPDAVLAVIDARRGEAFAAAYEAGEDGSPRELVPPRPLAPQHLAGVIAEVEQGGGARRKWLAVGDGAVRFREQLQDAGVPVAPDSSELHLVSAAAVCELGAHATAAPLHELVPDYRRRPDAELALVSGPGPS